MCNWYSRCGGAQGTICGSPAGPGEGCENIASGCNDCFRGHLQSALPEKDKEPKKPKYFVGHFVDGLFILASARGLARHGLRRGDALISIDGKRVTPALMRRLHKITPAVVEVVAVKHRNGKPVETAAFTAGRSK